MGSSRIIHCFGFDTNKKEAFSEMSTVFNWSMCQIGMRYITLINGYYTFMVMLTIFSL
jgi:hypothetical protein